MILGNETVKCWLDELEDTLQHEASLAGLLGQGTLIGTAREFFVSRVLRSILPPSMHIGSGRVIGATAGPSKQVDVVIYDPRFPVLEIVPGFGLYTVEGVIAALEVKSKLDARSLKVALENCFSVSTIEVRSNRQDVQDATLQLMPLGRSYSDADIPYDDVLRRISPQTYIFAFNCSLSDVRLAQCVEKWWKSKDIPFSKYRTRLPGVIVAGDKVGLSFDGVLDIEPSADARHECITQHGEDTCIAMGVWKTKRRFGWLAMHMLRACCSRIGQIHADLDVRLDVSSYLPAKQYFDSELKDRPGQIFGWRGQGKADDK